MFWDPQSKKIVYSDSVVFDEREFPGTARQADVAELPAELLSKTTKTMTIHPLCMLRGTSFNLGTKFLPLTNQRKSSQTRHLQHQHQHQPPNGSATKSARFWMRPILAQGRTMSQPSETPKHEALQRLSPIQSHRPATAPGKCHGIGR